MNDVTRSALCHAAPPIIDGFQDAPDWRNAAFYLSRPCAVRPRRSSKRLSVGRVSGYMFLILRQVIGDREPRRFGANENVLVRADTGLVDEATHRDMHKAASLNKRIAMTHRSCSAHRARFP